jgi:hypothetical protein
MSALLWQRGTLYPTGSVVRPTASQSGGATAPVVLENPSFDLGTVGWRVTGAFSIVTDAGNSFNGTQHALMNGPSTNGSVRSTTSFPVTPGQEVRASCMIRVNAADQVGGTVAIVWMAADGSDISASEGNQVNVLGTGYRISSVAARAPANAAFFQLAAFGFALQAGTVRVDNFLLNFQPPSSSAGAAGLIFRAVQTGVGTSAAIEPTWPTVNGQTVVDGTVTWEAFNASVVAWEAKPLMTTGTSEPVWPTVPGGSIIDGNGIAWVCTGRQVKDARCPQSKVVAIAATKVFAADGDVVRYSASGNPLDWSSADDAGFLPMGLQQNGANRIDVLNLYRGNLVAFNASTFQMWQIDPDPEQMALLDTMEGIGSVSPKAAQPVGNDLFFLTLLGVRTVGIAAGSTNLQAGDVGMPIDPIVQEAVAVSPGSSLACYYPAAGQYWLIASEVIPLPGGEGGNSWTGDGTSGGVSDGGGASGGAGGATITVTASPPVGIKGQAYTFQLSASGGTPPYTWATNADIASLGITLNATTGAANAAALLKAGGYLYPFYATDANGATGTGLFQININAAEGASIPLPNGDFANATNWTVIEEVATPGFSFESGAGRTAPGFLRWQSSAGLANNYWGDVISHNTVVESSGNELNATIFVRCTNMGPTPNGEYSDLLLGVQIFEDAACTIPFGTMPNAFYASGSQRINGERDWTAMLLRIRVNEGLFYRLAVQCRTGVAATIEFDDSSWNAKVRVP